MTDRLTPPMLRDLADVIDPPDGLVLSISDAHRQVIGRAFREEAARREAEQPCDRPGECEGGGCLKPSACQAAAVEDKPAHAADLVPLSSLNNMVNERDAALKKLHAEKTQHIETLRSYHAEKARADRLAAALTDAEKMFRWYGDLHAAKEQTPENADKTKRNYDMADKCAAALASEGGDRG